MCYDYQRFLLRFPLFVSFTKVCHCRCIFVVLFMHVFTLHPPSASQIIFYALLNDITIFCPFSSVIQSCHTKREPLLMCATSLSYYSIFHNSMTIFSNDKLFDDEKMVMTIRVNNCKNMVKFKTNKWEIQRNRF